MVYYCNKTKGVNADIARHSRDEKRLRGLIHALEQLPNPGEMEQSALSSYRNILNHLLASKAETVSKIGRNTKN